jgi:hypothetical protein
MNSRRILEVLFCTCDRIYLSSVIGLSPGGSSTVHIYTQTIHRTTQIQTNVEECRTCPDFASFTLAFALQLRKKHGKTSVQVRKTSVRLRKTSVKVQYTYYRKHPLIRTHAHTHTHTHTLQSNIKPPQYKLKRNTYRESNNTYFLMLLIHRCSTPILTGPSLHFTALHLTSLHFTSPTINTLHGTPRFNPLHCTTLHFTSIHCTFLRVLDGVKYCKMKP